MLSHELLHQSSQPPCADLDLVPFAVGRLELLRGAQALEGPVDHDAHPGA